MAIDLRIGQQVQKSLQPGSTSATTLNPYPYIGIVKNNLDPTRCGRIQVFIPELGGNPDDQVNWRTVSYASPFMGHTSTELSTRDSPDTTNGFTHVNHTYGLWMVPPDVGIEVLVIFVAGDPMRGYWIACVNSKISRYMLPALGSSSDIDLSQSNASVTGSYTSGPVPVVEFNENVGSNQTNPAFYANKKPIHEVQYKILVNQGLDSDTTRGAISSSSQRETPSAVFGISTPGRPVNDPATDPNYVSNALNGTITDEYYRVKARKGGHTLVMDDGAVLGQDQLMRLRTAQGHQILMHDTEKTLYISHADGTSWIELDKNGSIGIYTNNGFNVRSQGTINFHSDKDINLNAGGNINLHAKRIGNVATTYSLPDAKLNSNTGAWSTASNQLQSIATVAPSHEPYDRNLVANTQTLSSSIFVDTNQLNTANTILTNYINASLNSTQANTVIINASITNANITTTNILSANIITANIQSGTVGNLIVSGTLSFTNSSTAFVGANLNVTGNVVVATLQASSIQASFATVGNISAVTIGNTGAYLNGGTLNISNDALLGLTQAAAINNTPIGNANPSTGTFTTLSASQLIYANATTTSTASTNGALVVKGGVGVAGNLNVGGFATLLGNIGIGTTNPGTFKLEIVQGTGANNVDMLGLATKGSTGGFQRFQIKANNFDSTPTYVVSTDGPNIALAPNNNQAVSIIAATGNVGIGVASPTVKLDINGPLKTLGYTVATLPLGVPAGTRTYVTDASAPAFLTAVVGGGLTVCPVFFDGTTWVAG